jgi:hypothetical protein
MDKKFSFSSTSSDFSSKSQTTRTPTASNLPEPVLTLQACFERMQLESIRAPAVVTLKRWSTAGDLDGAKVTPKGASRAKYHYKVVRAVVLKKQEIAQGRAGRTAAKKDSIDTQSYFGELGEPVGKMAAKAATASKKIEISNQFQAELLAMIKECTAAAIHERLESVLQGFGAHQNLSDTPPALPAHQEEICTPGEASLKTISQSIGPIVAEAVAQSLGKIQDLQKQISDGLSNLDATRKMLMLKYDSELSSMRQRVSDLSDENRLLKAQSLDGLRIKTALSRINEKLGIGPE